MNRNLEGFKINLNECKPDSIFLKKARVYNSLISYLETNDSEAKYIRALIFFGGSTRLRDISAIEKDVYFIPQFSKEKFISGASKNYSSLLKIDREILNFFSNDKKLVASKKPFFTIPEIRRMVYDASLSIYNDKDANDFIFSIIYFFGGSTNWNKMVQKNTKLRAATPITSQRDFFEYVDNHFYGIDAKVKPFLELYNLVKRGITPKNLEETFNSIAEFLPPIDKYFFLSLINESEETTDKWKKLALDNNLKLTDITRIAKTYGIKPIYKSIIAQKKLHASIEGDMEWLKENGYKLIGIKVWMNKYGEVKKIIKSGIRDVKPFKRENNTGMVSYSVYVNSKINYLHRLVAQYFVENKQNFRYVSPKDGDFTNVSWDNLIWVEYPAVRRVKNNFDKESKTWLSFIIKNFEDGINITNLSDILADIAEEQNIFEENKNKASTIYTTIVKYSAKNKKFPVFNIRKDLGWTVYLDKKYKGEV